MIISIRGTSGSGKSTLTRRIMADYAYRQAIMEDKRKQPIAYLLKDGLGGALRDLVVLGHYESPCGGCDTIPSFDRVFELVRFYRAEGYAVLFEGVLLYCEVLRTVALHKDGEDLHVITLSTSLDLCVESVNLRRFAKKADATPVDPANTAGKHKGTVTTMKRLQAEGVNVEWADRDAAYMLILDLLTLNPLLR
jgi:hypothetical protein